ncbi:hypothetical protein LUZ60_014514 [Juncus effusus]|nr:hypothetical protein LUZ60_014514 [Juncus effusus]
MASLAFFTISFIVLALLSYKGASVRPSVPALFVFGDSLADVGNNNYLDIPVNLKSNYLYYGIDFPGRVATGRFTNGFNSIDYIAQNLGFKMSPPPYLSIKNTQQMNQGVSFASSGSGILKTTNNVTLNMATQVKYFKHVTHAMKKKLGARLCKDTLAKSLYIVVTASNDMFAYYASTEAGNSTANTQFISGLVDKFIDQLTSIYKHGGRKLAIYGTGQIGCIPYLRNLVPSGGCIEELNQLSLQFNTVAKQRIHQLSNQLAGFNYSYSNSYNVASTILASPTAFGFTEIKSACCGAGKFNGAEQCNPNATYCSSRNEYFFWDWVHPTQAIYNLTSYFSLYANSTSLVEPVNFKQLVDL